MEVYEQELKKEMIKIESAFQVFFKKYNMKLKSKSKEGIVYGNSTFDFHFKYSEYFHNHYDPIQFEGLKINFGQKSYGLINIMNFIYIEKEQGDQYGLNTNKLLKTMEDRAAYVEKYFVPFLEMEDNFKQMEAYLKKTYPWY